MRYDTVVGNCGNGCPDTISCGSFRGVTWPGNSPSVITVGAVDKSKNLACFSSGEVVSGVGIKPDFAAPGVDIKSSYTGGSYASLSGTSMAAPHVSGAVALMLSKNPNLKQDDVKRILEKTALDFGAIGKDTSYGFGLIDLAKALIYKEGLEFSIGLEKQIISGATQKITVTVYDDVQVNSVKATITKPNNAKSDVTLTASGNSYSYDFTDTALLGNYVVDVTVEYGGSGGSGGGGGSGGPGTSTVTAVLTASFKVTGLTGDFGSIKELNVSGKQFLSKNLTANITFANTAATGLDFYALLQLFRLDGDVMEAAPSQEIRMQAFPVASKSQATLKVNNLLDVLPGNYTLRILADYGAGSLMNETNITVVDNVPPLILNVTYSNQTTRNRPLAIVVKMKEHSPLAEIKVAINTKINYTSKLISQIGQDKELAVTIYGFQYQGWNAMQLKLCDAEGNCANSSYLYVNVSGCNEKQLLVMKTYEEKSAFEEAAAATGLGSKVCLSVLNKAMSGTPPASYLEGFDAVIWSSGTDFVNIDDNDAAVLADYYGKKGRIAAEGSDVAFRHGRDDFMHSVLHSELKNELDFFTTSSGNPDNPGSINISITRPHVLVSGLESPLFFNFTIDPFPDVVATYNKSVELAAWKGMEENGSAIIVYEDDKARSLFLPFSIAALNSTVAKQLANKTINWLLGQSTADIKPIGIASGIPIDSEPVTATAVVDSTESLSTALKVTVFADDEFVSEGTASASEGEYRYGFTTSLKTGQHTLKVVANSDFSIKEGNYVNNVAEYGMAVYPKDADLLLSGLTYNYDDKSGKIVIGINASNLGGTAATTPVKAYLDGEEVANQVVELGVAETKTLAMQVKSQKGVYELKLVIDPDNKVAEFNESNNVLQQKIFLCEKEKVLVVDDNDAEFFSTPEPSSADDFMAILKNNGYCADVWDERESSTPDYTTLGQFDAVVWSAGNYFGGTINNEDAMAIGNYSRGILLEGSDLGLDHAEDAFFEELTGAAFSTDLILDDMLPEPLAIRNHGITADISATNISKEKSPYPDGVDALTAEVVAEWQSGKAAITANSAPRAVVYFAFALGGIINETAKEKLVLNAVQWLLENANKAPELAVTVDGTTFSESKLTLNEGETKGFGAVASDPDGDQITFKWLLNGTVVSTSEDFSFSPKDSESGDYNLTVIVSDGKAETRAEILLVVLNTLKCNHAGVSEVLPGKSPCDFFGDLSMDGSIDLADVITIEICILGQSECTQEQVSRADVNDDGEVDMGDVVAIERYILGLDDNFLACSKLPACDPH